jgi:hypothetical protein
MTTTETDGWYATAGGTLAPRFTGGKFLCGRTAKPGEPWRPQLGNDRPATCPTCDECRKLHARRWAGEAR